MTILHVLKLLSYRLITLGIVLLGINFSLTGCHTAGLGQDIQGTNEALENAAESSKPNPAR